MKPCMGFVLVGHSRGASEKLTIVTNLRTTSSWHDLYTKIELKLEMNISIKK